MQFFTERDQCSSVRHEDHHPQVAPLLERTVRSNSFSDCPSPQAWISFCNAVSKTVNLPSDATVDDVDNVFRLAHKLGCKGIMGLMLVCFSA